MNRHHAAILILAAWVGALGWLAYRELFVARGPGASGWPVPPGSSFQAIRLGRRQIGVATLTVDTIPGGLRVVELTTVDLPADGSTAPRRTTQRVESLYSRKLALLSWDIDMLTEHGRERAGGRIIGDSVMTVVQAGAGQLPETLTVRVPGAVVLPGAVTLAVAAHGLPHHGMLYEFQVFDPLELAVRAVRYTAQQESLFTVADSAEFNPAIRRWVVAHADTVRAWRLDGIEYGLPVSRWTDAAGQPVRVTHPLGATMERSAFELVNTNFRSSPPPVWDHGPTVPAYPRRESDAPPEQFRWVALRLEPPEQLPAVLPALDGGFQRRSADTLYPALPSDTLPPATPAESRSPLLEADSMVQALAGGLNATDPGNRARMLEARLRRAVRLRSGPVTSPATAVLRRGTGTEAERALVVVAIARETGLAARRAWGLCWQDGAWQVRPWAEIWNDGWMPVDVGAGARPGDRVRLGIGGGGQAARPGHPGGPAASRVRARRRMIRLKELTKRYGKFTAVDAINLEIRRGELFGFLGPNGAGKTTTMRMIAGILQPTSGTIEIAGDELARDPIRAKSRLGFIPDRPFVYDKLTGAEFLRFVAALYGQEGPAVEHRLDELLDLFELTPWKDELVESYSHGMRQKLIISSALLHRPEVIVVDEPMVGLDPKGQKFLKDLFRAFVERGGTVLMSTHTLDTVEEMCDRIGIISAGRMLACGTLAEVREQTSHGEAGLEDLFLKLTGGVIDREMDEILQ